MIRKAVPADAEQIQVICETSLGYPCESSLITARLAHLNHDEEVVFVEEIDDTVVGFVHGERYCCLYFEDAVNILGLAVLREFQRQGCGRRLMEAVERWARTKHILYIRLNSGMTRTDAHSFYRKIGYTNEKEQMRFLKKIE